MKTIFSNACVGLLALGLAACGDGSGLMDSTVRAMASDEQMARYDSVVMTLREDDAEALEAMMIDGFPEGFAQEAVEFFPNEEPIDIKFQSFNTRTNIATSGRTRSEELSAVITMEQGEYFVGVIFAARGDEELALSRLVINPLFEEANEDSPAATEEEDAAPSDSEPAEAENQDG